MKSFFQFLFETASQQAARLGLKGDGHGGWYDNKGEFVAKTEKGSLKFYNKRQRVGQQDPPSTDKEKKLSQTTNNIRKTTGTRTDSTKSSSTRTTCRTRCSCTRRTTTSRKNKGNTDSYIWSF